MKTNIVIVLGAVVSGLIIIQIMFLLFANKPEIFIAANSSLAVDSLHYAVSHDSLAESSFENHGDSLIVEKPVMVQSAAHDKKNEANENKINIDLKEKKEAEKIVMPVAAVESVNVKTQAQMLEAMGADGAAKVMSTMNDKEVKAILPKLKKRTAAKILVSFDPNRAARLLR